MVYLDEKVKENLSFSWKDALVVKLLGKKIGYVTIKDKLKAIWKLMGGFELVEIGHGHFIVKCDLEDDRIKVIEGGPWMIFYPYLAVQPWTLKFATLMAQVEKKKKLGLDKVSRFKYAFL